MAVGVVCERQFREWRDSLKHNIHYHHKLNKESEEAAEEYRKSVNETKADMRVPIFDAKRHNTLLPVTRCFVRGHRHQGKKKHQLQGLSSKSSLRTRHFACIIQDRLLHWFDRPTAHPLTVEHDTGHATLPSTDALQAALMVLSPLPFLFFLTECWCLVVFLRP